MKLYIILWGLNPNRMSDATYHHKVEWLFNQFPVFQKVGEVAYKPTLDNTLKLVQILKVPYDKMKFVHVAGTNGKGTTCSIIASGLTVSGKKVGLFTSPHIKDFRERIRINGKMISEEKVVEYINLFQNAKFNFSPSFFEMTWAMALAYFYESKCDVVVVETGLGGRLDATNIILPKLSVITNIGLEHTAILGNTRAKIAGEKAGIIKKDSPVIIGEYDSEIKSVFIEKAKKENAPIKFLENKNDASTFETNKRLAFLALEFLLPTNDSFDKMKIEAIENLYENTGLYGRNHVFSQAPLIVMDAAHNFMAIQRFIHEIQQSYPHKKVNVLYGASNDKNLREIGSLFPFGWNYYITEFKSERSTTLAEFKKIDAIDRLKPKYFKEAKIAFEAAQNANNENTILIVFGSFFLLEEII